MEIGTGERSSGISIFRKINRTDKLSDIFDNVENSDIEN